MKKIMLLAGIVAASPVLAQGPKRMDKGAVKQRSGGARGSGALAARSTTAWT